MVDNCSSGINQMSNTLTLLTWIIGLVLRVCFRTGSALTSRFVRAGPTFRTLTTNEYSTQPHINILSKVQNQYECISCWWRNLNMWWREVPKSLLCGSLFTSLRLYFEIFGASDYSLLWALLSSPPPQHNIQTIHEMQRLHAAVSVNKPQCSCLPACLPASVCLPVFHLSVYFCSLVHLPFPLPALLSICPSVCDENSSLCYYHCYLWHTHTHAHTQCVSSCGFANGAQ